MITDWTETKDEHFELRGALTGLVYARVSKSWLKNDGNETSLWIVRILDQKSFYAQSLDEGKRIASHRILNLLKQDVLEAQRVVNHLDSEVRRTPTNLKPSSRKKPSQDISR